MTDISKCTDEKCPLKDFCSRHKAKDGHWQSYANFPRVGGECEYFIDGDLRLK
jgi:hypothetical protein